MKGTYQVHQPDYGDQRYLVTALDGFESVMNAHGLTPAEAAEEVARYPRARLTERRWYQAENTETDEPDAFLGFGDQDVVLWFEGLSGAILPKGDDLTTLKWILACPGEYDGPDYHEEAQP